MRLDIAKFRASMRLDVIASQLGRRSVLLAALASTSRLVTPPAFAEYGAGANVAPPAMVPSPFKPTGEMAKTCEVVALGREDVCLEPKKVMTAYDSMRLGKANAELAEALTFYSSDEGKKKVLEDTRRLIPLLEANDLAKLADEAAQSSLGGTTDAVRADLKELDKRCKRDEASPAAEAMLKLAKDVVSFADGG